MILVFGKNGLFVDSLFIHNDGFNSCAKDSSEYQGLSRASDSMQEDESKVGNIRSKPVRHYGFLAARSLLPI
jgi:hypothetical protein